MSSYLDILKSLQQSPTQASFTQYTPEPQETNLNNISYSQSPFIQNESIYSQRQSYIEYVPFRRKVLQFQERIYREKVPHIRKINDQIQKIVVQTVPRQRTETDYYAVQHLRYYQKEIIPEKSIQYVPVVRTVKRTEFVPVERKIVHYPKDVDLDTFENQETTTKRHHEIYERTPSFSRTFFQRQQVTQKPQVPVSSLVESVTSESPVKQSPIKAYVQDSSSRIQSKPDQIEEAQDRVEMSILNSLTKAYQTDESTRIKQSYLSIKRQNRTPKKYQVYSKPITKYEQLKHYRPSTLKEINYKSTQTIESRHFRHF